MPGLKICLAASGGGHVRQLFDLDPAFAGHDCYFVTEATALGQSIRADRRAHFVTHVALGQARLGAPLRMAWAGARNAWQSLRIVAAERPDVVITTGAGSMAFTLLWARLFGAKIMLIDSFARFTAPSAFARIAGPIAHVRVAQSPGAATDKTGIRRDIAVFDPFRLLDGPRPAKRNLLFATVGATLPFDRLVSYIESAAARGLTPAEVVVQVGDGGAMPAALNCVESLPFDRVQALLADADIVVCHAGTGSLITALRAGCHVITVPRLFALREHYDDHQSEIAEAFAARRLVQVADDQAGFDAALAACAARTPVIATTDPQALIGYIRDWLATVV